MSTGDFPAGNRNGLPAGCKALTPPWYVALSDWQDIPRRGRQRALHPHRDSVRGWIAANQITTLIPGLPTGAQIRPDPASPGLQPVAAM